MPEAEHGLSEVLLEVAQTLTANLDLSAVLPMILDQLARLVDYDSASIMLLENDLLRPAAQRSVFPVNSTPLAVHPQELAHVQLALTTHQPVLIEDTARDTRWRHRPGSDAIRCWLGVPLIVDDQVVGMLNISHRTPGHFGPISVQTAGAFAGFAAIALNNAALHQQLHDELAERSRIEAELREERAHLTVRVAEQTSALRVANQEMVQAARMKDEFMAAMSHELHTPLNTIIAMTDVLREGAYGVLNERQQRALTTVAASSRRLLSLISDVLDVARIESGKLQLLAQEVDVDHLCRVALAQCGAVDKKQRVSYRLDPAATTLIADERRLRQILGNLLSNAVKFTAEGGAIGLEVQVEDERDCLAFTVWDTGIGIDDGDLHRLFRPFAQLDGSLSRRYEGTGLGLTIVHRLVAMHGGSLAVTSRRDEGSHFVVRVPRRAISETIETSLAPGGGFGAFVLILTGLEHASDLVACALRARGQRVEVMLQGGESIPITEHPDLIVVNSHLLARNLLQTLHNLRRSEMLNTAPIVVLAALHLPGDREAALNAGAAAYFVKPLSHQEFDHLLAISYAGFSVDAPMRVHNY